MAKTEKNGKWLDRISLAAVTTLCAACITWGAFSNRIATLEKNDAKRETDIAQLTNSDSAMREMQGRIDERLKSIEEKVKSIDDRLSTLTDWLQQQQMERGSE